VSSRLEPALDLDAAQFAEQVRLNQQKLRANLKPQYDFIVCGLRVGLFRIGGCTPSGRKSRR
jgi:hypothetical protein